MCKVKPLSTDDSHDMQGCIPANRHKHKKMCKVRNINTHKLSD